MNKKLILAALAIAGLSSPVFAQTSSGKVTTAAPTYTTGTIAPLSLTTGGALRVDATVTPSGTQDTNLIEIGGTAVSNTTPGLMDVHVLGALPAGTNNIGDVDAIQSGTWAVNATETPSATSSYGITAVVSSAAEDSHVLKASAGNLYSVYVTAGATAGYLMVFDATSEPADGAVTPIQCVVAPANMTTGITFNGVTPEVYSTGITASFSTTGCFTKTTTPTVFFHGSVK